MPRISVIVPVYKVEKYLKECIDSILAQTYSDFELILIDDGSPDCCGEICDVYAKRDKRIKAIHQQNKGLSAARNAGLDMAEGEYITFIDSDDVVNDHYLEELYQALKINNAEIAVCNSLNISYCDEYYFVRKTQKINLVLLKQKAALISLYSNNPYRLPITAWGKLYKKELFDNLVFPEGRIHEDQYIIPIIIFKTSSVAWIQSPLYGYRQREDSIMHRSFSEKRYDDIEAVDNCIRFFSSESEMEIVELIKKRKIELLAYYSLLARKAGINKTLPREYQMSRVHAIYIMKKLLPYDVYSYRVAKIYPQYISIEAHIRRLLQIIGLIK